MKILVIKAGLLCLFLLSNAHATSDEWTQRWKASPARSNENLAQANLIELRESDYYESFGKARTTVYNTSSNSIGTVNTPTHNIAIDGSENSVDISSELFNEAPVSSNSNQNSPRCPNVSNQPGETLC
ncbi:hypothetical protein [Acinetobacter sp. ASP199]|uniref:hypothetical protein n=1 Tax=unclassified Acinetobacter TaxID=196816 RepID=UPI001F604845|nr:hypothetical protein [Acinetobacter sp. ASP199]UNT58880.1 hypothetical protein IHE35_12435 [Acinetobacter sp. ASP199]